MDLVNKPTIEAAKSLLGVKISYQDHIQTYSGYTVETEAYLGFKDKAAYGFGGRQTPKVTSLYERGEIIYGHVMYTHLLIDLIARREDIPKGVLIRVVEPEDGIEGTKINRSKPSPEPTNGLGKWIKAFNIPRTIGGPTINQYCLSIDVKNRKSPREIGESARIGIPNRGEWTKKHSRYTVRENPHVSRVGKSGCLLSEEIWK